MAGQAYWKPSKGRNFVYIPTCSSEVREPEMPQRVCREAIYTRFNGKIPHRFRPRPKRQRLTRIAARRRKEQNASSAPQIPPLLQVLLVETVRIDRVRHNSFESVFGHLSANSDRAMRGIDL
jgi:hypothetical protein